LHIFGSLPVAYVNRWVESQCFVYHLPEVFQSLQLFHRGQALLAPEFPINFLAGTASRGRVRAEQVDCPCQVRSACVVARYQHREELIAHHPIIHPGLSKQKAKHVIFIPHRGAPRPY
jgi:hypothetical protein